MGYDVYGLNPTNPLGVEKPLFPDNFSELKKHERDEHWARVSAYEEAVPGDYWRSNVWWWRGLWSYTIEVCDSIMSDRHIDAGMSNDGIKVPKTTAKRMADKLLKAETDGTLEDYEKRYNQWRDSLDDEECVGCNGTGIHQHSKERCNPCGGKGMTKNFMSNYPFKSEVAVRWRKFVESSGGFQVW